MIEFDLLGHQSDFINSKLRYVLNSGGVGSGKTYSVVLKTLSLMIQNPGIFILIGAQTYPLLKDTTLREFLSLIPQDLILSYNKTEHHFVMKNGSEVIFRSFDDETKLKSLNLGACGIEEMTDISEEIFKMIRTRMRQNGMPGCVYGATNPGTFGNWVYKYFIENPIENSEVIYSVSTDNSFLPKEYIADLEQIKKSNPEYYDRMVQGRWGAFEGLIYNLTQDQRNAEMPKKFDRFIGGLDFGFTHPTAFIVIGVRDDVYYLVEEVYRHKLTSGDIKTIIKGKMHLYDFDFIYCDSARPEIIEDLRREQIPAVPGIKDVFEGIMHIKTLIGSGKIIVSRDCKYTLREFDSYIWDAKSTVKEIPVKVNDDCMDAVRYAIYSDFKNHGGTSMEIGGEDGRTSWDW